LDRDDHLGAHWSFHLKVALTTMELVLGLGTSGAAMARWLGRAGKGLRVADSRAKPPHWAELAKELADVDWHLASDFSPALLAGVDRVWLSPGLPRTLPCVRAALAMGIPVGGELALFAEICAERGNRAPVLAITGTNGKSTVTALTAHLLSALGFDAPPLGNFGTPILAEALARDQDNRPWPQVWVVELSSFQLEGAGSFAATAATVLNFTPDHLDRHGSLAAYAAAKGRCWDKGAVAVWPRDEIGVRTWFLPPAGARVTFGLTPPPTLNDWGVVASGNDAWLVWGERRVIPVAALPLIGRHNVANALAALALVTQVIGWDDRLAEALTTFTPLPHRMALVATRRDGVRFVEDSKGTNVGATAAAIASLDSPVRLIAGGDGKGQDFAPLAKAAKGRVVAAYLYGRDREALAAALAAGGIPAHCFASLDEATQRAAAMALPGEVVLLSPACASWDQFRDYHERAERFVALVRSLVEPAERKE